MESRISQRDLARLAGVSSMTVSLALRGHPSISPATRERIAEIAKEHHYRPDPALAALNAYRLNRKPSRFQGTIAWVTTFSTESAWRQMIQMEGYYQGAAARADELGYHLETFWVADPQLNRKRATQILLTRGIKGLIIAPLPLPHATVDLDWRHFAAVALGYSLKEPHLHVVMNHQSRNMKHTVHHLHDLGYRRIGLAMPSDNDDRVDHNYLSGFLIGQRELPKGTTHIKPLLVNPFSEQAFTKWFYAQKPDAIVVSAAWVDRITDWLKKIGIKVPRDLGLAVAATPYGDNHISGMNEDVAMIGGMATDTVVGMIHRNEQDIPVRPWNILAEGIWFSGKTTRKMFSDTGKNAN